MSNELTPDCGRIRNEIPSLLYGELSGDARAAVELHLATCAACREEQATLTETRALLARWETPVPKEDPRVLARQIAAQARAQARPRGRLVRFSAALAGAAAALLFTMSLFGAQVSGGDGRFQISFGLPGSGPADTLDSGALDERVRSLVAQEVSTRTAELHQGQQELMQRYSQMTRDELQEELLRLARLFDEARAQDQRAFDTRLTDLSRQAALADQEQRQVINGLATDLVSLVRPVSNSNR